jgi:septum formation protein
MAKVEAGQPVVLASGSAARARLLREAGIAIAIHPARIDEAELKAGLIAEGTTAERAALCLAEWKAAQVSRRFPGRLVLGADQILECSGEWFEKPKSQERAKSQLVALRGKAHVLHSAAALVQDGQMVWRHGARATMHVRGFSDEFLERYLEEAGREMLESVGSYRLEDWGAQLFDRIEGDYFTVLGLPLLPVIAALRDRGMALR